MLAAPLGSVIDEAGSFEERLVLAEIDLKQADRSTALRTIGSERYQGQYVSNGSRFN